MLILGHGSRPHHPDMGRMGPRQAHQARPLRSFSYPVDHQLLLLEQLRQVNGVYVFLVD